MPAKEFQWNWFRIFLVVIGIAFSYLFIRQSCEIWTVHQEIVANRLKIEQVQAIHQSLADEKLRLNTPDYIEQLARDNLGLVKPGEVPYLSNNK